MKKRGLTPRNRIECDECEEVIDGWGHVHRRGTWETDSQSFDGKPLEDRYCKECWREHFGRASAAYYKVESQTDVDRLWATLDGADGTLVMDSKHVVVGARPYVRIVDGFVECLSYTMKPGRGHIITTTPHFSRADREWFESFVDPSGRTVPTMAMLKPVDETPFDEYSPIDPEQSTLEDVAND